MPFRAKNHYVSCLYLKRFGDSTGRVFTYRILVEDSRVPVWKKASIKGAAYHKHLYTRIASGSQTDEVEKWFAAEFEDPAEEVMKKPTGNMRLSPTDWGNLVRFLAAQDVRTPASLLRNLQWWKKVVPGMLDNTVRKAVSKIEKANRSGETINFTTMANSEYIPLRVTTEIEPGQEFGQVKAEVIIGRGLWLYTMKHALTNTAKILHNHKWSILMAPDDLTWFTSDDPVVRLNYYGNGTYDFKGGWGKPGTEIFLPLDPQHLLYTKVGERPPPRGSIVPRDKAEMIRRFIAGHAHRFIFAASPDSEVPRLCPRKVDPALLRDERQQWSRRHEEQTIAERQLTDASGEKPAHLR